MATPNTPAIATAPAKQVWTHYFRYAFAVGVLAVLFPMLILVGTATRLAAARREERYAAMLTRILALFEPRLASVRVAFEPSSDPWRWTGTLSGQVRIGRVMEAVSFPLLLQAKSGELTVGAGALASAAEP